MNILQGRACAVTSSSCVVLSKVVLLHGARLPNADALRSGVVRNNFKHARAYTVHCAGRNVLLKYKRGTLELQRGGVHATHFPLPLVVVGVVLLLVAAMVAAVILLRLKVVVVAVIVVVGVAVVVAVVVLLPKLLLLLLLLLLPLLRLLPLLGVVLLLLVVAAFA